MIFHLKKVCPHILSVIKLSNWANPISTLMRFQRRLLRFFLVFLDLIGEDEEKDSRETYVSSRFFHNIPCESALGIVEIACLKVELNSRSSKMRVIVAAEVIRRSW